MTSSSSKFNRMKAAMAAAAVTTLSASVASAATVGINFMHGDYAANTGVDPGENTATLDAATGLDTPTWGNVSIVGTGSASDGRGTGTFSGILVSTFAANSYSAGPEALFGSDASQQVFRMYLDDGDGGQGYFNGDSIGASVHITGIQNFLTSVGASSYTLTIFHNSDNFPNTFPGATVWQGVAGTPSATAISSLTSLGTTTVTSLGTSFGGGTAGEGTRAYSVLSGLAASDIVISMPVSGGGGARASISGFAITAVPEPSGALLGGIGLLGLLRRRRA